MESWSSLAPSPSPVGTRHYSKGPVTSRGCWSWVPCGPVPVLATPGRPALGSAQAPPLFSLAVSSALGSTSSALVSACSGLCPGPTPRRVKCPRGSGCPREGPLPPEALLWGALPRQSKAPDTAVPPHARATSCVPRACGSQVCPEQSQPWALGCYGHNRHSPVLTSGGSAAQVGRWLGRLRHPSDKLCPSP